ncbi:MAG: UDP-4-amino-4,6-dideoxy-N-acetyl-beta-L-altrosamine transaminase [Methanosarcinales archaeon]|nr:UDP-4-amino-4,6-dideoxy-N-acetyl-beta-L-altrosamine transaminase [Methanosarcinales archaeon]
MKACDEKDHLAINGGKPVRETLLPYGHQNIDEDDIQAVIETLRSDWITTGPKVAEFEEAFADRVSSRYAVSFSSGTAALHGAAFAAGLGPNDEAITTPMTFCATSNCVLYRGANPVFADISRDTMNIDPEEIASYITSKTKAILPVDYAGHPSDLSEIMELAESNGLLVIEDGCHALGAKYKGKRVGSISHMTVFSFHPVKHITTGEGGMVTTDDAELARRLRLFRNHGIDSGARQRQAKGQWYYEMIDLGYNYRLTDIASALGLSQLKKLDQNLLRRREIASRYRAEFEDMPGIILPTERSYASSAWHLYPIRLDLKSLEGTRSEVFAALRAENIGVNVHYIPVHLHPYYRNRFGYRSGECPVAEASYESLISLPIFHSMTDQDVQDVIKAVSKVLGHYSK